VLPEGWLCTKIRATAPCSKAFLKRSRISTVVCVMPPEESRHL